MHYLLYQPLDEWALRSPDHEAIRCEGESLTYAELCMASNRLANVLLEQGVRRGDRVGLYLDKGIQSSIGLYGIMKAGAAYVPLDPQAPVSRVGYILRDCDIRTVVSDPSKVANLAAVAADTPVLESVIGCKPAGVRSGIPWEDVRNAPDTSPSVNLVEKDLSYILYTSGSTGVPKGVMHTHRSALVWAHGSSAAFGFTPEDRISNYAPLHFDLSTLDYFSTAVAGGTTVVIPELVTKLPASLSDLIARESMTVFYTVPFALTHLALYGAVDRRDLSALRWVLFGGEPMPPGHLRTLMDMLPGARFANVYGPTEVNGVTYHIIPPLPDGSVEPLPIGVPFENVDAVVVDGDDGEVEPGSPGELLIRSATMMRGYWADDELNHRVFTRRSVFGSVEDVYVRTGDLVRQRDDGDYEFLGRMDRQIKTRGYRVELDEVEAALATHPSLEATAVYSVPDDRGSRRIEGAVTLRKRDGSRDDIGSADLIDHARSILPSYAVPVRILILDDLPRTTTGKIDRNRLEQAAERRETVSE